MTDDRRLTTNDGLLDSRSFEEIACDLRAGFAGGGLFGDLLGGNV